MMKREMKRLAKRALFRVRRDPVSGHLWYPVEGKRLYIRSAEECERPHHRRYALDHVYFGHYRPGGGDVVVDFGAGLGTEIVGLAVSAPDIRYIAVEIQPWVYECLSLTLQQLPAGYVPYQLSLGGAVRITPTRAGIDGTVLGEGQVPVEGIDWAGFIARHDIAHIDLLKMNIEGAEAHLADVIDWSIVRRAIISAHDFRADRGDGEHFRTRAKVTATLEREGFTVTPITGEADWMRSWIYAARA